MPHFIQAYSGTEDVLTRAAPFLTFAFLLSGASAIDLDWPGWAMVLASIVGLALVIGAWAGLNTVRGRPRFARPDRIGAVELTAFLVIPTLLPILFGGDLAGSGLTLLTMLVVLGVAYIATSYGIVAISVWAVRRMFRTIEETLRLFARGLPLLLLGFTFLFINAEAWQSAGRLDNTLLLTVAALFALLAGVFLATQIPRELKGLEVFESWEAIQEAADDAPVAGAPPHAGDPPDALPLQRREWGNVFLVLFISQGFRLVLVSGLVGLFFVVLGVLIIQPDTITLWTQQPVDVFWEFSIGGTDFVVSRELLRVSGFLSGFAAVYFSVYTVTDATLRHEFFEDTAAEMRQNLAVRVLYRLAA